MATLTQSQLNAKVQELKSKGLDDNYINTRIQDDISKGNISVVPDQQQAQPKSLGGFVKNVGADIGANISGIASLPGLLLKSLMQPSSIPDTLGGMASGIANEYGQLISNPIESAYNRPVSSLLDILPFLPLGKLGKLGKAGKAGETASVTSKTIRSALNSSKSADDFANKMVGLSKNKAITSLNAGEIAKTVGTTGRLGAIGEILQVPGRQASKATASLASDLRGSVRNFESVVSGDPFFSSSISKMNKVADEAKLSGSATNQLSQAQNIFDGVTSEIRTKLSASKETIPTAELKVKLLEKLNEAPYFDINNASQMSEFNKIFNSIEKKAQNGSLSYADVFDAKQNIGSKYKSSFNMNTRDLRDADIVALNTYQALKDAVESGVKGISPLTEKQSVLFDITKALKKGVSKPTVSLGAITPKVPGLARATQGATDLLGRAIGGLPNVAGKLPQVTPMRANLAAMAGRQGQIQPMEGLGDVLAPEQVMPQAQDQMTEQPVAQATPQQGKITPELLMVARLQLSDANYKKIKDVYDLQQGVTGGGKQLPAGELGKLADTQLAIGLVPELNKAFDEASGAFGPITGRIRGAIPYDTQAQKAQSVIFLVKQIIGKGLEGGVLRKEDEYKYEKILPQVSDTPETVKNKIDLLNRVLTSKYNTTVQTFQTGGYNPFGGSGTNPLDVLQSAGLNLGQ